MGDERVKPRNAPVKGYLLLEDGRRFDGELAGYPAEGLPGRTPLPGSARSSSRPE